MRPMGPAPVTSTSSPSTSKRSAVWTALPKGSKMAATSSSMPGQWCQTLVMGRATYSAKAPSRPTPRPMLWAQRWRRPARQWRQRPQTTWPSPLTMSPAWKSLTLLPTSTISPTNSWPTTSGGLIVRSAQASQDCDVQVRAADAGLAHPDEHVVDAHGGLRHLGQLQARAGLRLHQGEHRMASPVRTSASIIRHRDTGCLPPSAGAGARIPRPWAEWPTAGAGTGRGVPIGQAQRRDGRGDSALSGAGRGAEASGTTE